MKKFLIEYINIIGYVVTGLIFSLAAFILFVNFFHYEEVNTTFSKSSNYLEPYNKIEEDLSKASSNINSFDSNTYSGPIDKVELMTIQSKLQVCLSDYKKTKANDIIKKKTVNMQDNYKFLTHYQSDIINDCIIMQLYSLNSDKLPQLSAVKPFIDHQARMFIDDMDYVKKTMQSNSSYSFSSDFDKINIYEMTRDSYTRVLVSYKDSVSFLLDVSEWYKKLVEGGI